MFGGGSVTADELLFPQLVSTCMRVSSEGLRAGSVFLAALLWCGAVQAQDTAPSDQGKGRSFWQAAGGIAAVNGLTWFYNWHLQRWAWANVGTRSWWSNLESGFAWDDDAYGANQLAHPYHGSLYFNSARASGYDFWSSTPFVAAGSLSWELFTENVRPSINDLINTTLGGIALGEVAYRMSSLLTSGNRRAATRQLGALVVNPLSRAQSLVQSETRGLAPATPQTRSTLIALGRRGVGASPDGVATSHPYVGLTFQYGSVFDEQISRPFDAFEFSMHLSPNEHVVLTHVSVSGLLARSTVAQSTRSHLLLGLFQHYDYDDLPLTKLSSQSASGALLYRGTLNRKFQLDLGLHAELVPLGAVSTEHGGVRRRDYDFGPGLGGRFTATLRHDGREMIRLDGRTVWLHSLYGADADHVATAARLSAAVPLVRMVSIGGDFGLNIRRSSYRDQPAVTQRVPQLRAYLIWSGS
jgi:Domain of unknown function (DUF3943)